jgi:hypothetical protein
MKIYEYRGEFLDSEGRDELIPLFNEEGQKGWKVVSILPLEASNPASFLTNYWYVVYVREKEQL